MKKYVWKRSRHPCAHQKICDLQKFHPAYSPEKKCYGSYQVSNPWWHELCWEDSSSLFLGLSSLFCKCKQNHIDDRVYFDAICQHRKPLVKSEKNLVIDFFGKLSKKQRFAFVVTCSVALHLRWSLSPSYHLAHHFTQGTHCDNLTHLLLCVKVNIVLVTTHYQSCQT